eukprot:TRINITY_DN25041_c0_g1_i1.p1 TRINITY_DN25041_c0_g1~~TRINITY_DN25041_c0_g1_i1.p1  ORF type:complete len:108 (+),score=34.58 TRINITY_DN25041_c0_g1_i1:183-506(+)
MGVGSWDTSPFDRGVKQGKIGEEMRLEREGKGSRTPLGGGAGSGGSGGGDDDDNRKEGEGIGERGRRVGLVTSSGVGGRVVVMMKILYLVFPNLAILFHVFLSRTLR